ncbi:hypothetical protein [Halorhodospira halochloris]|uniref:hypothetical protein n=1 Tax=Halorhodospira halochloris TaxID=1052 RepID=UPI001EE8224E|nr:hypothetical protein [Halorhodospira halochloris]MCG5548511.1 hypothetical protein [Halorhodospira halochloris]
MNPSLEASWRHPWRQDLHTGADGGSGEVFTSALEDNGLISRLWTNIYSKEGVLQ